MQHQLWIMTLDNHLHLAPVKENPQNVLDIGTGTGIWAIDYGGLSPSALRDPLTCTSYQISLSTSYWK
jgi:ubiquinone/menaquinone biosynthesis C-methylase UbiE